MFNLLVFTSSFGSFSGVTCSLRIEYSSSMDFLQIPEVSVPYVYNHNNFTHLSSDYDGTFSFNCEGCIYNIIVSQYNPLILLTEDGYELETEDGLVLET